MVLIAYSARDAQRSNFCKLALPLYDVEGLGTVVARDVSSNGSGCVIDDHQLHFYADGVIVDFDCTVHYPEGWEGSRPERVAPAEVAGFCGRDPRTAPNGMRFLVAGALMAGLGGAGLAYAGWSSWNERAAASASPGGPQSVG